MERIIGEAYRLLMYQGFTLHHKFLLGALDSAGARVDYDKQNVRLSEWIINKAVQTCPENIQLWDIKGERYKNLGGDNVHFTPGSAAIKIYDSDNDSIRLCQCRDMMIFNILVEQLPNIDYSATSIVPNDVPKDYGDSVRLFTLLVTTSKSIVTGAFTIEGFDRMLEMMLIVRGTREALREKPFTIFSCCPTAPLKWSNVTSDNTMQCAKHGIPVEFISMPLAGFVAPMGLVGSLIQHTAETLSGVVISQFTNPGAPVLWGGSPGIFDMRTTTPVIAALEAQMIDCAYTEIGKRLGIPTQAYIGLSDAKRFDAQAGFESGTGMYMAALAGINSISGPGMLYFESCFSFAKLVMDNEICGMAKKLIKGIEPLYDEFPIMPLFQELLADESLVASENTVKHLRDTHYIPGDSIDRDSTMPTSDLTTRALGDAMKCIADYEYPNILDKNQIKALQELMPQDVHNQLILTIP